MVKVLHLMHGRIFYFWNDVMSWVFENIYMQFLKQKT